MTETPWRRPGNTATDLVYRSRFTTAAMDLRRRTAEQELFPRRHRVLSTATMRALRSRSADAVRDQVLGLSIRRAAPSSYPLVRRVLAHGPALNSYAEAQASGRWSNTFLAWCMEPPTGAQAVPATWITLNESETTNSSPRLREARTFAVPRRRSAAQPRR